ncbi:MULTISPECIES: DUF317 domain-containing protein [Streptomyces]|uniref:DUF317 domain-containing protein n=1 Tax=Streptomyces dengpaensis TaxID=2049881 RepID=A0ABN5HX32_9ACTN|nr:MULTISPECIES: DUF317 domain-containing protein [Streptomyces]AVH55680.1 DUF317 domain-containing protein [Streptomyces dengpaensis]PIB11942.1 hypothetical protein B1C81_01645 [Streptomyces sp. HG99]
MPTDPAQDRPREKILISPRYLAASLPNDHRQLLDVFAEDSTWSAHTDESSVTVTSPCQRITIRHDQSAVGQGAHLVISARTDEEAPERWRTDVSGNVPIELVARLISTLAHELASDPDHVVYGIGTEHGLLELYVDADVWNYFEDSGLSGFISHDGHAAVVNRAVDSPTPPIHGDASITWHLAASPEDLGHLWDISLTDKTPPFLMHAVVAEALDPRPTLRSTTFPVPAVVAPLVTIQRAPSPSPRPSAQPPHDGPPRSPEPKRTPKTR